MNVLPHCWLGSCMRMRALGPHSFRSLSSLPLDGQTTLSLHQMDTGHLQPGNLCRELFVTSLLYVLISFIPSTRGMPGTHRVLLAVQS